MYAMSLTLASTQISVCPGLTLRTGSNNPLTVNFTSRSESGRLGLASTSPPSESAVAAKRCKFVGTNWNRPRKLLIDRGPAYHTVAHRVPFFDSKKFTGARDGR